MWSKREDAVMFDRVLGVKVTMYDGDIIFRALASIPMVETVGYMDSERSRIGYIGYN